ncbi:MAG TPA: bifunctional 5,10-methylenetetrahydrofolate dehydrogenase/5,10-methenyltetrahydrofolate cyclohydrolase [Gaiellaceae bacterium]|nr:bifunctional 5,10-methylenetetrahydrofolate dehydrogenase/5,10-methenyltetrahydrofolate cyclohydrolase [Gaiellaceae bacterium]
MSAVLMMGGPVAERVRARVREEARQLGEVGLATVLVGDDPASHIYVSKKHEAAEADGLRSFDRRLPAKATQDELLEVLDELNRNDAVDGILVQLPLPEHIDVDRVLRAVDPIKDVDGFHPFNAGRLYAGKPTFVPATPLGIMTLLAEHGVELEGARAVVVGRSTIVGKPMLHLLLGANATVTVCHTRTRDLAAHTREADVIVVGVGRAGVLSPDMVRQGAVVIDVGITRTEHGIVGDVEAGVAERAGLLTPVPGGVGPMTIAMLLGNTIQAAKYRRNLLAFP